MGGGVWCAMCISSLPGLQTARQDTLQTERQDALQTVRQDALQDVCLLCIFFLPMAVCRITKYKIGKTKKPPLFKNAVLLGNAQ